jgi:hypothetical protein
MYSSAVLRAVAKGKGFIALAGRVKTLDKKTSRCA